MTESLENKKKTSYLSEAVILATVPLFGFFIAFTYELGYSSYFGIPYEWVSMSSIQITIAIVAVVSILIVGIYGINTFFKSIFEISHDHPGLSIEPLRWAFFLALPIPFFGIFELPTKVDFAITGVVVLCLLIHQYVWRPFKPRFYRKWYGSPEYQASLAKNSPSKKIRDRIGFPMSWLILGVIYAVAVSGSMGMMAARKEVNFLTLNRGHDEVVLRVYGDKMIVAPLDRTTHKIEQRFSILTEGDDPQLVFISERIGPLSK